MSLFADLPVPAAPGYDHDDVIAGTPVRLRLEPTGDTLDLASRDQTLAVMLGIVESCTHPEDWPALHDALRELPLGYITSVVEVLSEAMFDRPMQASSASRGSRGSNGATSPTSSSRPATRARTAGRR